MDGGGPNQFINLDLRVSETEGSSVHVATASSGDGYGVAWAESLGSNSEIYFAKVNSDASIEKTSRLTNAPGDSARPSVAWNGSEFGVVWHDYRDDKGAIYFVRVSASGDKLFNEIRVTDEASASDNPHLVWNGTEYGLVWQDTRGSGDAEIYFNRLFPDGTGKGPAVRITDTDKPSWYPVMAWSGSHYGLAWCEHAPAGSSRVAFQRISALGSKSVDDFVLISSEDEWASSPRMAWSGSEYLIAWDLLPVDTNGDGTSASQDSVAAAVFSSNGQIISSEVLIANGPGSSPSIVWTGSEVGIAWGRPRPAGGYDVVVTRTDTDLAALIPAMRITHTKSNSFGPALLWNDDRYNVGWSDDRDGNYEIYLRDLASGDCETSDNCNVDEECVAFECEG